MIKKIAIFGAIFIATFIFIDFLFSKIIEKPCMLTQTDGILQRRLRPNSVCQVETKEFAVEYRTNSYGLRDVDFPKEKPTDVKRILFLGDSFTFGTGVSLENTMVKKVEKLLNNSSASGMVQTINAGVGGHSPIDEYLYLKYHGVEFDPDLVIVNLHMNDFVEERAGLKHAKKDEKEEIISNYIEKKTWFPRQIDKFLQDNSFSYNIFLRNEEKLVRLKSRISAVLRGERPSKYTKGFEDFTPGDIDTDLFAITRDIPDSDFQKLFVPVTQRLLVIKKFLNERQIPMIIVIIPNAHQVSENEWQSGRQIMKLTEKIYPRKIFDELDDFAKSNNILILDMSPYLISFATSNPGTKLYYDYDGHFTPLGQEVAADTLAQFIKNSQFLRFPNLE